MSKRPSREASATLRRLRHAMRTSIGQIMGYTEMLQEEVGDGDLTAMARDLERIHSSATTLLGLVDRMLNIEDGPVPAGGAAREDSTARAAPRGNAAAGSDRTGAGCGGSLLVVDDSDSNRDLLCRRLVQAGHRVETAVDGEDALRKISGGEFDLVLLDVIMPGIDGFEVLARLRRTLSRSDLPVIVATALDRGEDAVAAFERGASDYVTKPFEMQVVLARIATQLEMKRLVEKVENLARELQIRNAFIRRTLDRQVSEEVATSLLENADRAEEEKRRVSVLISDLRGFTRLAESLRPVDVVRLLNNHLGTMAEVVESHGGTIDAFIGDAVLALFGAPISRGDDAARAVACSLAMQQAMCRVNEKNRELALPAVEMGIGIATGDVVVGNIGSERRAKYTAIGRAVNLAARIESYTTGGEIVICPATLEAAGSGVRVSRAREVRPKGFDRPVTIHRVAGWDNGDGPPLEGER